MRRRFVAGSDDHLFASLRQRGLQYHTVRAVFRRLVRKAKLHRLRPTGSVSALPSSHIRCESTRKLSKRLQPYRGTSAVPFNLYGPRGRTASHTEHYKPVVARILRRVITSRTA